MVHKSAGQWKVTAMDDTGKEASTTLFGVDVYSAASGDFDGDGRDDLVLGTRTSANLQIRLNQSTSPTFAVESELVSYGTSAVSQNGWPVVVDLDNDGDLDLAMYDTQDDTVALFTNDTVDATANAPTLLSVEFELETTASNWIDMTWEMPAGSSMLDVSVWKKIIGAEYEMVAQAHAYAVGSPDPGETEVDFRLDVADSFPELIDSAWFVVCREVTEVSGGTELEAAGPATFFMTTVDASEITNVENSTGLTFVPWDPVNQTGIEVTIENNGINLTGRELIPGTVETDDLPPPDDQPHGDGGD